MPVSRKFYAEFLPDNYYHIYNRANRSDGLLFYKKGNYLYFLQLLKERISGLVQVWAYCLLPNHFHILAKVAPGLDKANDLIIKTHQKIFISYSQAINDQEKTRGSVFQKRFKRVLVSSDDYISQLILYIHKNPEKHGLVSDFRDWEYSSYRAFLSSSPTSIARNEVLEWFGSLDNFELLHREFSGKETMRDMTMET